MFFFEIRRTTKKLAEPKKCSASEKELRIGGWFWSLRQGRAQLNARPADRDARLPAGTALGWLASTITRRESARRSEASFVQKFSFSLMYF